MCRGREQDPRKDVAPQHLTCVSQICSINHNSEREGCLLLCTARPHDHGDVKGVGTRTKCVIHTHSPTFTPHAKMGKAPGWA